MSQRIWFAMDPERAHRVALGLLRVGGATSVGRGLIRAICGFDGDDTPITLWGRTFRNRLGLAAGWDKDGLGLKGLAALPFGHVEIGTVTPRAQPGNPKPRVFRLPQDRALINRMGFPGRGAEFAAERLANFHRTFPDAATRPVVGVNIGRNKDTPNDSAIDDYRPLLERFAPLADYVVINISSPNTAGLRELQARRSLEAMLGALRDARHTLPAAAGATPLLLKLSPDLDDAGLDDAVGAALAAGIDGIIISNTTVARDGLTDTHAGETGGMSGAPLAPLANRALKRVVTAVGGRCPIIASGGVMSADDFRLKRDLGADLVQVYTGLVYGGARWPRRLLGALAGHA